MSDEEKCRYLARVCVFLSCMSSIGGKLGGPSVAPQVHRQQVVCGGRGLGVGRAVSRGIEFGSSLLASGYVATTR